MSNLSVVKLKYSTGCKSFLTSVSILFLIHGRIISQTNLRLRIQYHGARPLTNHKSPMSSSIEKVGYQMLLLLRVACDNDENEAHLKSISLTCSNVLSSKDNWTMHDFCFLKWRS